jgi:hypothetical protein
VHSSFIRGRQRRDGGFRHNAGMSHIGLYPARVSPGQVDAYPPLIWLAAPEVLRHARLSADASSVEHAGKSLKWATCRACQRILPGDISVSGFFPVDRRNCAAMLG